MLDGWVSWLSLLCACLLWLVAVACAGVCVLGALCRSQPAAVALRTLCCRSQAGKHGSMPEVKIVIPDELKHKLVDDWDNIARQKKLIKLPRPKTISAILADYCAHVTSRNGRTQNIANEVASGLKVYFEQAIGTILLYQYERRQYEELLKEDPEMDPCEVFGAEHLLRLFVKLPGLLAHTNIEERNMAYLVLSLQDILKHMTRHIATLFPADSYEAASAEYLTAGGK